MSDLAWGEMPYDSKTPREVIDDYVLVRGDLVAEYAREQLADWIDRYADHRSADMEARIRALSLAMSGVGAHRDPCRLPDTPCLCGVCDFREEAVALARALLDAAPAGGAE